MLSQQNITRSFVQANLSAFSNKASKGFSKSIQKFYKDMLFGLCATGSPSIHNIAKLLQDRTSTKKTSERLYRNLRREGIDENIGDRLIYMLKPMVKKDTLFIVDESDIEKPYAKKMEGCQKVHNGKRSNSVEVSVVVVRKYKCYSIQIVNRPAHNQTIEKWGNAEITLSLTQIAKSKYWKD